MEKFLAQAVESGARIYIENDGIVSSVEFSFSDGEVSFCEYPLRAKIVYGDFIEGHGLTAREDEIIKLVLEGYTYRYISHRLLISEGTVKKTVHNAYQKLGITSKTELFKMQLTGV